ncbi:MAG: DmsC/YnfH family molybdoenzyme membrane anchor subunit [Anaerolineales bacterium]
MTYAFTFDASACTGCKACQVACKDKNNLPVGVLWRRVFEVSGGDWAQAGNAWENSIFAYNLSIACNHCAHPKCAGVCPTDAYVQRADGVVYIDETKCMGCGYCAWACPYAVPQYNPELRHMTKCNFCFDEIDQGKSPACVAACPMRVLDFVILTDDERPMTKNTSLTQSRCPTGNAADGYKADDRIDLPSSSVFRPLSAPAHWALWDTPASEHPFPLPEFSRTEPHLAIKPHVGMVNGLEKVISNREETQTQRARSSQRKTFENLDELPLVAFTLLTQMSAGMAVASLFFQPMLFNLLTIGLLLGLGGLISFLHLGTKKNAWRAVLHLRKSWLSREILVIGLFGAAWLAWFVEHWFLNTDYWLLVTAPLGVGLVYSMTQVYRLRAAPVWDSWRTGAAFFLSAGTLGLTGVAFGAGMASVAIPLLFLLSAEAGLVVSARNWFEKTANRLRLGVSGLAMVGGLMSLFVPSQVGAWMMLPIFLLVVMQEIIGRWLFYEARVAAL